MERFFFVFSEMRPSTLELSVQVLPAIAGFAISVLLGGYDGRKDNGAYFHHRFFGWSR